MSSPLLQNLTIRKAHAALSAGEYTVRELAESYLAQVAEKNADINAYLEVFEDVRAQAEAAQERFKNGTATLLTGIPFAIKDNMLIEGRRVGAASKILEGYVATYDATVIKKLKAAGAIFLGRSNMDEFAMGGSNENSAYGPVKNPHDTARVSGGSSGGSAAAVAANMSLVALGSDTGGSVRQPAGFCGVVGFKPTYGAVSRSGLIAMGSSLDQIGPIGKTVDDTEIIFNAIKGHDPLDSTSLPDDTFSDTAGSLTAVAKVSQALRKTIGVPRGLLAKDGEMRAGVDADVLENFEKTLKHFSDLGYTVSEIDLPELKHALSIYYIVMPAEASTNLERFDGVKYGLHKDGADLLGDYVTTRGQGFGKEVRRRIMLGTYVLSSGYYDAYYTKAEAVREMLRKSFTRVFESVDMILTPTSPTPAFKIGEKSKDPLSMYLEDIFTVTANLVGVPAISLPSGFVEREEKSLPLGIQLMAPHGREDILFAAGKDFLGESARV